jgi:hypothetical protein
MFRNATYQDLTTNLCPWAGSEQFRALTGQSPGGISNFLRSWRARFVR